MNTPQSPAAFAIRESRNVLTTARTDLVRAVSAFSWPNVGPVFNWGTDWFDVIARDNSREALVIVEENGSRTARTFQDLSHRSDQLGAWLLSLGVSKGDPVLLMLGNRVELWESMLALIKIGAVILPTTVAVGEDDLRSRLDRGAVRCLITADIDKFAPIDGDFIRVQVSVGESTSCHPEWAAYDDAFRVEHSTLPHPDTTPHDPLLRYFTSGTTSRPKLVEHTQVSYPIGHLTTLYWLGLQPGDVHLAISSPGWAKHAWSCFFAPWLAEATIFVSNYERFDAATLLDTIRAEGVTSFCAPPTVWRMLIQADLSGGAGALREVISAGEPLNSEVIAQVRTHWDLTIRDGYGQTEMTAIIANPPGESVKDGSMGRALPGCPVVLIDPVTGIEAQEGEICLDLSARPLNLMTGYVGDDARNQEATAGGRFHTGDLAYRDADGYLTYVGRTDDVFKSSDYKISPFELESALLEHPAVAEAAVVPAPDEIRLTVPKAYVSLATGHSPDAETAQSILSYARSHLAPYQRVRRLEFFALPKTISGKIRRVELREREERIAAGEEICDEWREDQFPELRTETVRTRRTQ